MRRMRVESPTGCRRRHGWRRRACTAVSLLAVPLLLAGCNLGPAYEKPAADLPGRYAAPAPADAGAIAPEWWRGFGSDELDRLMADARGNSFDIQAAIARIRQADAALQAAGAPLLPTLTANGSETWTRGSGVSRRSGSRTSTFGAGSRTFESRDWSLSLGVSYEFDFWGRLRATQQAAAGSALFSRYDAQTVSLTTLTSVANTYFAALALEDRLDVARRNLRDAEEILRALQGRLAAGVASMLDVAQQEALVAGIRAQIPSLTSQRDQQVNALAVLVGRAPERVVIGPGTLTKLRMPNVAAGLPSDLLARRPDIGAAEAQLLAQNANIRAARAAFFPRLSLTGSGGWESTALSTLISPASVISSVTASVAQTVFDNGNLAGQLAQQQARYEELLVDYRRSVVQALTDVEDALTALRYATEQEALETEAVRTAQRAADIARAQVLEGTSDIVTALQAQSTLFNDLDLLAQVRLSRFQAIVNLYKALGGGFTASDVVGPETPIFNGIL